MCKMRQDRIFRRDKRSFEHKRLKKQPISVRVGTLGVSESIRIPKEIQHLTKLKKGEEVIIYPASTKKLILELKD